MILLLVFYVFFFASLVDSENNERVSLLIDTPKALQDEYPNGISPIKPAFFGFPQYLRGSVNGVLVYPASGNQNGCNFINKSLTSKPWPNGSPVIVIVDRGECTFVTKVKNAQAVGASACLVVDNIDEEYLPYMADDGTEDTITIPSLFMRKSDGEKLKEALLQSQVLLQLSWEMPNPDDRVEWDFWHVPDDLASKSFKKAFKAVAESLGSRVMFTPHYAIVSGKQLGCLMEDDGALPCDNACTNRGRYCYFESRHTRGESFQGIDGVSIVEESLRQLCLWKIVNQTKHEKKWWDYVVKFDEVCKENEYSARSTCSGELMSNIFDHSIRVQVDLCVIESGDYGLRKDNENTLLENEIILFTQDRITFIPEIRINQIPYRGSLVCPVPVQERRCGVLSAICSGFYEGTLPEDCGECGIEKRMDFCGHCEKPGSKAFNQSCAGCDRIPYSGKNWDACGVCDGPGQDTCGNCFPLNDPRRKDDYDCEEHIVQPVQPVSAVSPALLAGMILGCAILVAITVFCFMRKREKMMRKDLDTLLKQYLPLDTENAHELDHTASINSN